MTHAELVSLLSGLQLSTTQSSDNSYSCHNSDESAALRWRTSDAGNVTRAYVRSKGELDWFALCTYIEEHPSHVVGAFIKTVNGGK
jgi:hypothetical protein